MTLKNVSKKVIGVGKIYLMPDDSTEITEEQGNLASIQSYVRLGLVELTNSKTDKPKRQGKSAAEAAAEEAAVKAAEAAASKGAEGTE